MERPADKIELYVKAEDFGWFTAYERNPIPGGSDMPVLCRHTRAAALEDAKSFIEEHGSVFKAQRSVV